jgi:NaMN:DMB phosphoribosyltransferase
MSVGFFDLLAFRAGENPHAMVAGVDMLWNANMGVILARGLQAAAALVPQSAHAQCSRF